MILELLQFWESRLCRDISVSFLVGGRATKKGTGSDKVLSRRGFECVLSIAPSRGCAVHVGGGPDRGDLTPRVAWHQAALGITQALSPPTRPSSFVFRTSAGGTGADDPPPPHAQRSGYPEYAGSASQERSEVRKDMARGTVGEHSTASHFLF